MKQQPHGEKTWEDAIREILDAQERFTSQCISILGRCLPEEEQAMLEREFRHLQAVKHSVFHQHDTTVMDGGGRFRRLEDRVLGRLLQKKQHGNDSPLYRRFIDDITTLLKPIWGELTLRHIQAPFWEDCAEEERLVTGFYRRKGVGRRNALCFVLSVEKGVTLFYVDGPEIAAKETELGDKLFYSQMVVDELRHAFYTLIDDHVPHRLFTKTQLLPYHPVTREELHVTLLHLLQHYPLIHYQVATPIQQLSRTLANHGGIVVCNRIDTNDHYTHTEVYFSVGQNILCWSKDYQKFHYFSVTEEQWLERPDYFPFISSAEFLDQVKVASAHSALSEIPQ